MAIGGLTLFLVLSIYLCLFVYQYILLLTRVRLLNQSSVALWYILSSSALNVFVVLSDSIDRHITFIHAN